jgi:TPR repeat protein
MEEPAVRSKNRQRESIINKKTSQDEEYTNKGENSPMSGPTMSPPKPLPISGEKNQLFINTKQEYTYQSGREEDEASSPKGPKIKNIAKQIMSKGSSTGSLSPSKSNNSSASSFHGGFGKIRRSSTVTVKNVDSQMDYNQHQQQQQNNSTEVHTDPQDDEQELSGVYQSPQSSRNLKPNTPERLEARNEQNTIIIRQTSPENKTLGISSSSSASVLVQQVRQNLEQLITLMDAVDPKKLISIRLGGELRGLLGKAQDEFCAYEESFLKFAEEVGVSIALQNFAASLHQVFPMVTRLQTATNFLLNNKFKREMTFAFQEINSYYTSLFMELSMAVAKSSGNPIMIPLQNPAPEEIDEATEICFEAHQYFFGHRKQKNLQKAFQLYQEAAEMDNLEAMTCLGQMYKDGLGTQQDFILAEKWLRKASTSGCCLDACYLLGDLCIEKAKNQKKMIRLEDNQEKLQQKQEELYAQAIFHFTQAAENGHANAQFRLGTLMEDRCEKNTKQNSDKNWYRKACSQHHTQAEMRLGRLLYFEGNICEATHYFLRAAEKNDPEAMSFLGQIFEKGEETKPDLERAISFYRKAVAGGSFEAMCHLATLLLMNANANSICLEDQEKNHDEAIRLLMNAAEGGIVDAYYKLGESLEKSPFLKDPRAALRYYCKAAYSKPPHPAATKRAAAMYYSGIGTTKDRYKAHEMYCLVASTKDSEALNSLGLMYEEGEGCDLSYKKAADCYRQAIEVDENPYAHFNLGCLYSRGKGVERNQDAAKMHFQKAMNLGYKIAASFVSQQE